MCVAAVACAWVASSQWGHNARFRCPVKTEALDFIRDDLLQILRTLLRTGDPGPRFLADNTTPEATEKRVAYCDA